MNRKAVFLLVLVGILISVQNVKAVNLEDVNITNTIAEITFIGCPATASYIKVNDSAIVIKNLSVGNYFKENYTLESGYVDACTLENFYITIDSPSNTTYTTPTIYFNITTNKQADTCLYSLNHLSNISLTKHTATAFGDMKRLHNAVFNVTFWCNSTYDNLANQTSLIFTVNYIPPGGYVSIPGYNPFAPICGDYECEDFEPYYCKEDCYYNNITNEWRSVKELKAVELYANITPTSHMVAKRPNVSFGLLLFILIVSSFVYVVTDRYAKAVSYSRKTGKFKKTINFIKKKIKDKLT